VSSFLDFLRQQGGIGMFDESQHRVGGASGPQLPAGWRARGDGRAVTTRQAGGRFAGPRASWEESLPMSAFQQGGGAQGMMNARMGALTDALGRDAGLQQQYADEQWGRNEAATNQMRGTIDGLQGIVGEARGMAGDLERYGQGSVQDARGMHQQFTGRADDILRNLDDGLSPIMDMLKGFGARGEQLSKEMAAIGKQAAQVVGGRDVEKILREGMRIADQAVKGFQSAAGKYENMTMQDASSMASAITRNNRQEMKMVEGGVGPDGSPLTMAQIMEMRNEIKGRTSEQVQEAITPVLSRFNETRVALGQAIAGLKMQSADFRMTSAQILNDTNRNKLAGLGLNLQALEGVRENERLMLDGKNLALNAQFTRAQIASGLNEQVLRSQEGVQQMIQFGGQMTQSAKSLMQSALLTTAQLEMEGRVNVANMIRANPRSIVSFFEGLLSLFSANAAMTGSTDGSQPFTGGGGGGSSPPAGDGGSGGGTVSNSEGDPETNRQRARREQRERNTRSADSMKNARERERNQAAKDRSYGNTPEKRERARQKEAGAKQTERYFREREQRRNQSSGDKK
jgi:hypothetical protein